MNKPSPAMPLQIAHAVSADATQRLAADETIRRSEIRYRRLFQTAKDGILILDANNGKIIDANAFMSGLLGQELPELLGKELWEIGLFQDIDANKEAFRQLQKTGYLRYDHLPVQNHKGETTQVEFISNVYKEGDRLVAQCNVRDVTARVMMEKRIELQAVALADQSRRKDEFLAMLSHELRNPLAPIRSAMHLLRLQERGNENPIQHQAYEVIERQVMHLTRLVSDLLEISRVVNGRIRLRTQILDMSQVVRHAVEATRTALELHRHRVSLTLPEDPVLIQGDSTRLEEIIVNLLSNATNYTGEDGRIDLSLEQAGNRTVLRIRDTGVGIAPEFLPHIFDLFTQANQTLDRSQGGLGIGLNLVQRLVELHGGTVEALSAGLGQGSEFIVSLPIAASPGVRSPESPREAELPVKGQRILVAEDNVDSCLMLAEILRLKGHFVQMAHTGTAAIQAALTWQPDAVLLDIGIPGLNGYEVAQRLRAEPTLRNIKLVAITGYGAEGDIQLAREAGFDAHLLKPIEQEDLDRLLATPKESRSLIPL